MQDVFTTLEDQLRECTTKIRDLAAGKTNRETVEKALALVESSANQVVVSLTEPGDA